MFLKAFLVGGLICGLIQILMDRTKLLPGRIMVLLVCLGIVAGVLGIYKPLVDFAGAGATVPLCGLVTACGKALRARSMMRDLSEFLRVDSVHRRLESARLCSFLIWHLSFLIQR